MCTPTQTLHKTTQKTDQIHANLTPKKKFNTKLSYTNCSMNFVFISQIK